jgi:hypothetical protein
MTILNMESEKFREFVEVQHAFLGCFIFLGCSNAPKFDIPPLQF